MQAGSLCCANARGCMDCVEPRHAPGCPYPFHGVCGCGSFDAADNVPQWNQQTMSPCPPLQCEPVTDNVGISMEDVSRRTIPRSYMIRPTSFHPPPEQLPMSNSYTHINPLLDAAERRPGADGYWESACYRAGTNCDFSAESISRSHSNVSSNVAGRAKVPCF